MKFLKYWDLRTVHIFLRYLKNTQKYRRIRSGESE